MNQAYREILEKVYDSIEKYREKYLEQPKIVILGEGMKTIIESVFVSYTSPKQPLMTLFGVPVIISPRVNEVKDIEVY